MTEPQPPTEEGPAEAAPEEGNIWFRRSFLTLAGFGFFLPSVVPRF